MFRGYRDDISILKILIFSSLLRNAIVGRYSQNRVCDKLLGEGEGEGKWSLVIVISVGIR